MGDPSESGLDAKQQPTQATQATPNFGNAFQTAMQYTKVPMEADNICQPVEEHTKEAEAINRQHMVLPSGKTLPRGGLDDSEEYFKIKEMEARTHERENQGESRAVPNFDDTALAVKRYDDAQNSFEIALGYPVFSGDETGHAHALGNLGNVKPMKGEPMETLRCYNKALALNCDHTSLCTGAEDRASRYITLTAKVNEGVGEWDEVPEDIVPEEPREAVSIQLPVEEQTKEAETINRQHMVLPSGKTLPRGGLDDFKSTGTDGSVIASNHNAQNQGLSPGAWRIPDSCDEAGKVAFGQAAAKPEPNSDPMTIQAQFKPQEEDASKCQEGKQASFSKKPTHKNVNAPGNLQAAHGTGLGYPTEPTWSREETGACTYVHCCHELSPHTNPCLVFSSVRNHKYAVNLIQVKMLC